MKKIKILSIIAFICTLFIAGCSDLNDMHQKYLDRGEKIYVGKIDSLKVNGGYYRAQIEGLMHYANTAKECVIRWGKDSVVVSLDNFSMNDTLRVIIDGLEEGNNEFYVQTYDKDGNSSLNELCAGIVYGEQYINTLAQKFISGLKLENDGIHISWGYAEDVVAVEIEYETQTQGMVRLIEPGNVSKTILPDWKAGGKISYKNAIIPAGKAIDTLYTPAVTQYLPSEFELDKKKFKAVTLPTDVKNGYNGRVEGIWDNMFGASGNGESQRYHSADGEGVPHHLTFDLGVKADLTRFEIWGRVSYPNWNPKKGQIWGIDDITNAATTLPSSDPGWRAEAESKGWKLLKEFICTDTDFNKFDFEQDAAKGIRYIRYRVTEVWGPSGTGKYYGCLQEMTVFGNSLMNIN